MIASAPASRAIFASSMVVAVANQAIRWSFNLVTYGAGNTPMMDDTAVGASSRKESHWASKSGGMESPAEAATGGPHASMNFLIRSSAAGSLLGLGSGIQTFN